jgi:hypothetical protein
MEKPATTSQHRPATLSKDHTVGLILTFLIAETSVMYTCYWAGHTEGVRESGGMLADLPYTLNGFHIVISFCLGLSFVGLWLRRGWGLIISSLALVPILVTYGYWHFMTVKYLSELRNNQELYRRVQQEVGFFLGATKWDFVVLVLVVLLLLWQLVKQIKMTIDRRSNSATA